MSHADETNTDQTTATSRPVSLPSHSNGGDSRRESAGLNRAVIYLRVSSAAQVNTDYDPEGISIPAQRLACQRKIDQMDDVVLVDEYVELGVSGTSMDKRPAFQEMLKRIREERDIDYVVIYKLSRLNRNRVDDALVMMQLRKYGVTLVSATEMIDATPEGQLMHGILATFNEFRSAADGADIRYKMGEKAKHGGTVGRAPLGYLNVRERFEGREIRTVAVDAERGPFVKQAFELYATGEYTMQGLCDELTVRGLSTRPGKFPAGPVSDSKMCRMLRDPYYLGLIDFKGEVYPGRHEPLISQELFDAVQEVLKIRQPGDERRRVNHHFLKGSLWCGACHEEGRDSRMLIQRTVGRRGGVYFYFFCRARQDHVCAAPHVRVEDIETAVERHYRTVRFAPELLEVLRESIRETLADGTAAAKLLRQQIQTQLTKLDVQEENLLDLAADASIPKAKLKERLRRISDQRGQLQESLADTESDLSVGAEALEKCLSVLEQPDELYRRMDKEGRKMLNQALFAKLYVFRDEVIDDEIAEPFAGLVEVSRSVTVTATNERTVASTATRCHETKRGRWTVSCTRPLMSSGGQLLAAALVDEGSSSRSLVGVEGLEPPTLSL
jgi:site-specific DNA recombinase